MARLVLKQLLAIFWALLLLINPVKLLQSARNQEQAETLMSSDFEGRASILSQIDARLAETPGLSRDAQAEAIADMVLASVRYMSDWENYGVSDYWAPPQEAAYRQRGDCEDRAMLLVNLLRARGWSDATIVASDDHVWVKIPSTGREFYSMGEPIVDEMKDGRLVNSAPDRRLIASAKRTRDLLVDFVLEATPLRTALLVTGVTVILSWGNWVGLGTRLSLLLLATLFAKHGFANPARISPRIYSAWDPDFWLAGLLLVTCWVRECLPLRFHPSLEALRASVLRARSWTLPSKNGPVLPSAAAAD